MTLTKDAKTMLYKLYSEYSDRRKHGFTKSDSKDFINAEELQNNLFPDLQSEDIDDLLRELKGNGFINEIRADGGFYTCSLSDYAIATLESLPKDVLVSAAAFLLRFNPPIISK